MKKARDRRSLAASNEKSRTLYAQKEKEFADWNDVYRNIMKTAMEKGLQQGRREGFDEGMEKGRKEEKYTNARKMKILGFSADQIQEVTGLGSTAIGCL